MYLEQIGHEVSVAYDGENAVRLAEEFRPQAILLDLGMPGIDGYEVCRRIRQLSWGPAAVIAALTGWSRDEDKDRSEKAGFDRFLVKPVDPKALDDLIAAVGARPPGPERS